MSGRWKLLMLAGDFFTNSITSLMIVLMRSLSGIRGNAKRTLIKCGANVTFQSDQNISQLCYQWPTLPFELASFGSRSRNHFPPLTKRNAIGLFGMRM